jgi:glycosyltransferase involved in cell wall biosynthesis
VARIITRLNIGGPAIQALSLASRLKDRGFTTLLIHGRSGEEEGDIRAVLQAEPVESVYIPSLERTIRPLRDVRAFWLIYQQLRRFRPHIVHTHMAKAGMLGRAAALTYNATTGRSRPASLVHTYHGHVLDGYFSPVIAASFAATERMLARFTTILIAISSLVQRDIETVYRIGRREQIRVVPLGFDLGRFAAIDPLDRDTRIAARTELGVPPDQPVITTVGRLAAIKHQHLFVELAQRLARTHPGITCLIVGDGTLRGQLEQQAKELGVADRVRFLGWRSDLHRIYAATDVFVLTSANEGTPVALIEALASGVAGVSTNVGGVADVIAGPECGVLVAFGDVAQLTDAVGALLSNPKRREMVGLAGRASVLARFGRDRLEREIESLYRELLGQQPVSAREDSTDTVS